MKIDKAIETLTEDIKHPTANFMPELKEAEKLGIEALKLVQEGRTKPGGQFFHDLPGETEE